MKIKTRRFGDMEVEENKVYNFPAGIPGFSNLTQFVLVELNEPIKWLQAVEDSDIAFMVTDPFAHFPDYAFQASDEVAKYLDIKNMAEAGILVMLSPAGKKLTANLKAPLVFNVSNRKAMQVLIDDERFSFKAPIPLPPKEMTTK